MDLRVSVCRGKRPVNSLPLTAAPRGRRTVRIVCQRLLQPTGVKPRSGHAALRGRLCSQRRHDMVAQPLALRSARLGPAATTKLGGRPLDHGVTFTALASQIWREVSSKQGGRSMIIQLLKRAGSLYARAMRTTIIAGHSTLLLGWCFAGNPTFSDANWIGFDDLPGADGTVNAMVVDAQGNLYIGGVFTKVGNTAAHCIAKWDGREWSSLGRGVDYGVEDLAALADGGVYAAGAFKWATNTDGTIITSYGIAKWDGERWSGLGGGVSGGVFGYFFVGALAVSGTDLYAGGYFSAMGGVPANYIARWNGSTWSAVGSGTDDIVHALKIFDGNLYAGGSFLNAGGTPTSYIARWNGNSWSALAGGLDYGVNGFAVSGTNLYVGGNFNNAFNTGGATVPARYVARWDGSSWSAVGAGMNNTVVTVAVAGSNLYAGGIFTTADGVSANRIARWDGSTWSALGSGTSPDSGGGADVKTLATWGDNLYAGGNFGEAGGKISLHVARAVLGDAPGYNQLVGTLSTEGNMQFSYIGYPASRYTLDRTFNLSPPVNWIGQETNTMTISGVLLFTNSPAPGTNNFWRVRSVP